MTFLLGHLQTSNDYEVYPSAGMSWLLHHLFLTPFWLLFFSWDKPYFFSLRPCSAFRCAPLLFLNLQATKGEIYDCFKTVAWRGGEKIRTEAPKMPSWYRTLVSSLHPTVCVDVFTCVCVVLRSTDQHLTVVLLFLLQLLGLSAQNSSCPSSLLESK